MIPSLAGLDYFLLPHFLDGLLQAGGMKLAVTERESWFHSPMCFIRDGPACLANLLHQQMLGLNMLRGLAADDTSEVRQKYDDYLPIQSMHDIKTTVLGGTRRHVASDQAMRAGGIVGPGIVLPAQDVFSSPVVEPDAVEDKKPILSTHSLDPELSETDNEDLSECRRRSARGPGKRKHLVSPSIARGRVTSLSRVSTSKRIKTEANRASDRVSITALPRSDRSSHDQVGTEHSKVRSSRHSEYIACSVDKPVVDGSRQSKYLVNRGHLAALMALGEVQPSPS